MRMRVSDILKRRDDIVKRTPDDWARIALHLSMKGQPQEAFAATVAHIRSKANCVMINGVWHERQNIMRTT